MTIYPGISDRMKALIGDSLVIAIMLFIANAIINSGDNEVSEGVRKLTFIGIVFLYEPIFVSFFGGTIGHRANGLRVKSFANRDRNIFILMAIIRSAVKYFLGIVSLLTMSSNDENRALHDTLSGSVVLYADKEKNTAPDTVLDDPKEEDIEIN